MVRGRNLGVAEIPQTPRRGVTPLCSAMRRAVVPMTGVQTLTRASVSDDHRETAETYVDELLRLGRYRMAVCRDGVQWLFQRQRLAKPAGGAAWDTLGYCATRAGLMRLHRADIGSDAPEIAALPAYIERKMTTRGKGAAHDEES